MAVWFSNYRKISECRSRMFEQTLNALSITIGLLRGMFNAELSSNRLACFAPVTECDRSPPAPSTGSCRKAILCPNRDISLAIMVASGLRWPGYLQQRCAFIPLLQTNACVSIPYISRLCPFVCSESRAFSLSDNPSSPTELPQPRVLIA